MTDSSSPTARERRDLMTVLARGLTDDLDAADLGRIVAESLHSADPCSFGPLADGPSSEDRLRAHAAQVLGELLYAAALLALGLRTGPGDRATAYLHAGMDRVEVSPVLRHLSQCPGEAADTPAQSTGEGTGAPQ
ncbi:hypothetical protein ACFV42_23770 [Streptomyces solisilvae]|uniref:hypothetical protein n=1 Tax=Streptomyces malaysiensis TaxID=92644 RepID=UPI0036998467